MAVEHSEVGDTERMLQRLFRRHSVSVEHDGDGKTEWFEARALPKVRGFIERNPEEFPSGLVALEVPMRWTAREAMEKAAAADAASAIADRLDDDGEFPESVASDEVTIAPETPINVETVFQVVLETLAPAERVELARLLLADRSQSGDYYLPTQNFGGCPTRTVAIIA
jgi:hypothetical protein